MESILQVSTILGGLAALWFFWDRLTAHASRFSSITPKRFPTIIYSSLGGIFLGVVGGVYGFQVIGYPATAFLVPGIIGVKLDDWGSETIGSVLVNGSLFIWLWGAVLALIFIFIAASTGVSFKGSSAGTLLSLAGGIAGAAYGSYLTD